MYNSSSANMKPGWKQLQKLFQILCFTTIWEGQNLSNLTKRNQYLIYDSHKVIASAILQE